MPAIFRKCHEDRDYRSSGCGKSSFIEALGSKLTKQGEKIAVLAIDPSSDRSKGSILGDKTRMESLAVDSKAFIRPSPSGGSLGGVARKTRESIVLCEAAGFDIVFVETVGVGQSETTVRSMVDFFLLLMLAGAGDELQGIKRGIMEMADLVAITKADGDNIKRAERARMDFQNALHLFPPTESGWIPQVVTCSATEDRGIKGIWSLVNEYFKLSKANEYFEQNRRQQAKYWMHEFILDNLKANFYNHPEITKRIADFEEQIKNTKITSYYAAQELLDQYFRSG